MDFWMRQILFYIFKRLQALNLRVSSVLLGLVVLNQAVIVQWLPNSEPDLAGYKVYYGEASLSYSKIVQAGLSTECTISDLEDGHEYYFAVTAYDTAGNESPLSEEVSIFIPGNENVITSDNDNAYNFPNPFNPEIEQTQFRYYLSTTAEVAITIFDIGGNKVRTLFKNIQKSAGEYSDDSWDGKDENGKLVSNGIYYANISFQSMDHYITIAVMR
jgi:hypothetical protein